MKYRLIKLVIVLQAIGFSLHGQGVELPDFVITGTQTVSIPIARKLKPGIVSTLSKEFFNPRYAPEEFSIKSISAPERPRLILYDNSGSNNYYLEGGVGGFTLPRFRAHLGKSFSGFNLRADAWGKNIKDYVDNSASQHFGGSGAVEYNIDSKGAFLPGMKIIGEGGYEQTGYRLYGSSNPAYKRNIYKGFGKLGFMFTQSSGFKLAASLGGDWLKFGENSLSQYLLKNDTRLIYDPSDFGFEADLGFVNQTFSNGISGKDNYFYVSAELVAKYDITDAVRLKAGIHHSSLPGSDMTAPVGSITFGASEFITVVAEYSPYSDFFTFEDFIEKNRFYNLDSTDNIFQKNNHNIKGTFKYEYERFYEFSVGGGYAYIDNYLFFDAPNNTGDFTLNTINDVNRYYIFGTAYFHLGPYGYFYGDATYQNLDHSKVKSIPNVHSIIANASYGYEFEFGLGFAARLHYRNGAYTDSAKVDELKSYIDISGKVYYELFYQFKLTGEIENIFNRANYLWDKYQEKSFDVIFGIEYRF